MRAVGTLINQWTLGASGLTVLLVMYWIGESQGYFPSIEAALHQCPKHVLAEREQCKAAAAHCEVMCAVGTVSCPESKMCMTKATHCNAVVLHDQEDCWMGRDEGCVEAGQLLEHRGALVNSQHIFEDGCRLRNGESCYGAGRVAQKQGQGASVLTYWDRACQLRSWQACYAVGWRRLQAGDDGADTISYLERACKGEDGNGCHGLGYALRKKDPARALTALDLACHKYQKRYACVEAGLLLQSQARYPDAARYLEEAYRLRDYPSLARLGRLYEKGFLRPPKGVSGRQHALDLYIKGCSLGHDPTSCENQDELLSKLGKQPQE